MGAKQRKAPAGESRNTENPYSVHVAERARGWEVQITEAEGQVVFTRHCRDETEARAFASTVRQHTYWLSSDKFRDYYRLPDTG
jgi:hypothetical protein